MVQIKLLSTDFDGTLVDHATNGRCVEAFAETLLKHRDNGGLWVINTGRSLPHLINGLDRFQAPITPDFAITHERELYKIDSAQNWQALGDWNRICKERHNALLVEYPEVWESIYEIVARWQDVELIEDYPYAKGLLARNSEVMEELCTMVQDLLRETPDFTYQRNSVCLRFAHRDYHKGSVLTALAESLDIPSSLIMAAGDEHNDLSMLDGKSAELCCCPSNAIPEVQAQVRQSGGYIASQNSAEGIAEAYDWFAQGDSVVGADGVDSEVI